MHPSYAAAYGRASTDKQDQSIAAQSDKLNGYALANSLVLPADALFLEDDVSGSIPFADRAKGSELLRRFRLGHFTHLIVPTIDRLGRRALDVQNTIADFHAMGATIHILDLGGTSFNTRSPVSGLIIAVLAWAAEMELERIRERVGAGIRRKQANNELCGNLCFGWDAVPSGEVRVNKGGKGVAIKTLVPNVGEQAWLVHIATRRAAGHTWYNIAQFLNSQRVPTKKAGSVWTAGKVQKLYQSKTVQAWLGQSQSNEEASNQFTL